METSSKGVCCLEIPAICKPRLQSSSCLNVSRSDPHFVLWYSRWKNFLSYLISNQCWSLANQNKSFLSLQTSRVTFSVKHFTLLLNQIFFFIGGGPFLWEHLFQRASDWIQVVRGYWKAISYHLNRKNYPFTGYQKPFKWWRTLRDIFSWNLKKIFRTSFFLRTSQDLLPANEYSRNKVIVFMNHRFFFHLSLLYFRDRMYRSRSLLLFFKIGVLKNLATFTGKNQCWGLFLIKQPVFRAGSLLKGDLSTCFPVNIAKILRTAFYIEHLRWLLLYVLEKVCLVAGFVFISPA